MDIVRLLKDHYIPFSTSGKNVTPGWVNTGCPICHDKSDHGGFNATGKEVYYHCWRCGWSPMPKVISKLLNITPSEAERLLQVYSGKSTLPEIKIEKKPLVIPGGPLQSYHRDYLEKRRFDPDFVIKKYGIKGTGPTGNFRFRLIFPITYEKIEVSYHSRDITGVAKLKTKACPKDQEIIPHKEIFYGLDFIQDTIVIVEGVFDAWRIGDGALATFGTAYSLAQVELLSSIQPKRVFIMYDAEPLAQAKAKKLSSTLSSLGLETHIITLHHGDPDDLTTDEVKSLREELKL